MNESSGLPEEEYAHAGLRPFPKFRNTITEYANVAQRNTMEIIATAKSATVGSF